MQLLPQVQFSHVQFGLSHLVDSTVSLLVMHMRLRPRGADHATTELITSCSRPISRAIENRSAQLPLVPALKA
ncbi:hypothetical protein A5719_06820 [Mycolicibacterium peregrinum]|uniref:Uncharacterized protein n=1 Tax=Mycolicibacterium peregrinum TaxID=43304 RepID=A0A1A0VPU5_MYCPR|nr:hypothetical protein A5779_04295 [Mycolicibacterium peregrinum]OBF44616.1 hypothetical protein A5719_06820 [Mycolicibacterium peregrinum]